MLEERRRAGNDFSNIPMGAGAGAGGVGGGGAGGVGGLSDTELKEKTMQFMRQVIRRYISFTCALAPGRPAISASCPCERFLVH